MCTRALVRRASLLAAVATACALLPAVPHSPGPNPTWWAMAGGLIGAMIAVGCAGVLADRPALVGLAGLIFIPAVECLRISDASVHVGYGWMFAVPIVWFGLQGSRRLLAVVIAAVAAAVLLPYPLVGAPNFPASAAPAAALLLVVITSVGVRVHWTVVAGRRAEARGNAAASQLHLLFEHAAVGMAITAEPVSGSTTFTQVNRSLCALLGRDPETATRTPLGQLVHRNDFPDLLRQIESADGAPVDIRLLHRGGHTVWTTVSCTALGAESDWRAWQFDDISAQRAADVTVLDLLEAERRNTQDLRVIEREHRHLLASISHDLRTPITAALGYSEMLADGEYGELDAEKQRAANTVTRSLTNLSRIINELVVIGPEMAKGEAFAETPVDVINLVDEAIQMVAIQASLRNQTIRWDCDRTARLVVAGDSVRLNRVVVNLLGNAVKFSPVGGTITVGLRGAARAVLITISDSGAGIPSVDQQRIFERFYRAPRETGDPTIRGSGLGLAIVKAIVTQHGGTIDVESHPGQGATFTVRLPLAAGPGGAGGPAASPDVAGAAVRPQRDDTVVRGGALTAASTRTDGGRH